MARKIILNTIYVMLSSLVCYAILMLLLTTVNFKGKKLIYQTANYHVWKGGQAYQMFREFDEKKHYDAIVLGSSHAYRGYDPRVFQENNIDLFNMGTSSQSIIHSYHIAKNLIKPQNTDLVIVDIYAGTFYGEGLESSMILITNAKKDVLANDIAFSLGDFRAMNAVAVRYYNKNQPPQFLVDDYVLKGYAPRLDSIHKDEEFVSSNAKIEIDENHLAYFEKLLTYLEIQKINYIIVTHPLPREEGILKTHQKLKKAITPIIEKHHAKYFDALSENQLNLKTHEHFSDWNHLNQPGVDIFNRSLIKQIKKFQLANQGEHI